MKTDETKRRIRKTKEILSKKVEDSIMIVNEDIEETAKSVYNMKKSNKYNILWLAYQQGIIFVQS